MLKRHYDQNVIIRNQHPENSNYWKMFLSTFINYPNVVPHPLLTIIPEWHALCIKDFYNHSELFVLNSDSRYSLKI